MLRDGAIRGTVLTTLISLASAVAIALIAIVSSSLVSYKLALGYLGVLLWYVVPIAAEMSAFIVTFKRLRAYISN
jgi:hypothetical protein